MWIKSENKGEEKLPSFSQAYEDLVEVRTRAVAKLNIDWPAKKQGAHPKRKLDKHFLSQTNVSPPS